MQLPEASEQDSSMQPLLQEAARSYQAVSSPCPEIEVSPIVTPLAYTHLKKASKTWAEAFEADPVLRYIDNNRKQTPEVKDATQFIMFCVMLYWKSRKVALTVDEGSSFIFCTPPNFHEGLFERSIYWIAEMIGKIFAILTPRDERKRSAEVETKVRLAVARSLGDRVNRMLYIDALATEPKSQGWGYGGALLDSVGALGDVTNQAIWLKSTNEKNTGFYMSHGYVVVAEAIVGDDNPEWNGTPVVIKIVGIAFNKHH
ncbi:hypothetical protein D9756_000401 [Leucocoprinus leucothites]|uniref:N-acetyltransferase domain-containing protein n=1 Tax=Leucocoprinus leucothites TaxID=201217 RepID=A0A8H5GGF3_9AGAR|nr:hypothetical protein D9756_000401 [Leucoagaricus leucothites]